MLNEYLLIVNALTCLVIVIRLLAYQRRGSKYSPFAALLAYALTVSSGSVTIRILTGDYSHADWSETIMNLVFCATVIVSRGNVMRLPKPFEK